MGMDRREFMKKAATVGGLAVVTAGAAPRLVHAATPKNAMLVEAGKCIGCCRCVDACSKYHNQHYGEENPLGYLSSNAYVKVADMKGKSLHISQNCLQCVDAPCVTVCQTHALEKLGSGVVVFDKSECIGCFLCTTVCPFQSITADNANKKISKCDYCSKITESGGEPNCVSICPPHSRTWGPYDQKLQEGSAKAEALSGKLLYAQDTATLYVLSAAEYDAASKSLDVTVVKPEYPSQNKTFAAGVKWMRLAWVPFLAGAFVLTLRWRGIKEKEVK